MSVSVVGLADLNPSIDGDVQLISSTAEVIMLRNVHRRTP
jgi:hypothetical protein